MAKMYKELHELFQINSIGETRILNCLENLNRREHGNPVKKKVPSQKGLAVKKSVFKAKSVLIKNAVQ